MTLLPVALAAAGASALINFWLATRIAQVRSDEKIWVGDGGNPRLIARMRAQLNFAEYTPLMLILTALIELAQGTSLWLWIVAAIYLIGRICHGFGMDGWKLGRQIGAGTTMLIMLGLALYSAALPFWLHGVSVFELR